MPLGFTRLTRGSSCDNCSVQNSGVHPNRRHSVLGMFEGPITVLVAAVAPPRLSRHLAWGGNLVLEGVSSF